MSEQLKRAYSFELLTLGPRIGWRFEDALLHIYKPGLFKPSPVFGVERDGSIVQLGRFTDFVRPVGQVAIWQ